MLLGQDLRRRHERDLQAVLHRHQRGNQRDDRLARADVALQQPVHRRAALHVVDDVLERVALTGGQLERQDRPGGCADAIVDGDGRRLLFRRRGLPPGQQSHLEEERLLEDQAMLRRRVEPVQLGERQIGGRKMGADERGPARRQVQAESHRLGQHVRQRVRQPLQDVVDQPPLHLRRHASGLLVDRDDPSRMNGVGVLVLDDLVLRIGQLEASVAAHLHQTEQHDILPSREHIAEKRLIEPAHVQRAGRILDGRLEDLESRTPRRAEPADEDPSGD